MLRSVNIPEPERRFAEYPHQLSGGMRQRVMIALALACGPRLLFADEPTTALDVTVQAEILNLLQDNQADRFMAMVLVTHDLGVVAGRTDEIAVMYAGKIVEQARTSVLFGKMRHPYTEALLRSIPRVEDPEPHPPAHDHRPAAGPASTRRRAARSHPAARTPRTAAGDEGPCWSSPVRPGTASPASTRWARRRTRPALQANLSAGLPQAIAILDAPGGAPIDARSARHAGRDATNGSGGR